VAYLDKVAHVEGVEAVSGMIWYGGEYKDPSNFFPQFAVTTDQFFKVATDLSMPEVQREVFLKDRTAAIAGKRLANRFGWKLGEKIFLKGTIWAWNAELTLKGLYEGPDESALYLHWDYFNEGFEREVGGNFDYIGTCWIRARSAEDVPKVAARIDALFQNTTAPTKTETEKAFVLSFVSMIGNIQLLITSICSVVIFAIVLVAANTMAMSIRERTREIGILKALGFRRSQVLVLLLSESLAITVGGALLGSWTARLAFGSVNMVDLTMGFIQRFYVTPTTLTICAAIGLAVGIVSAGVPAWQAARRPVVEALRQIV
jgi:putative ABC transport system permease protein